MPRFSRKSKGRLDTCCDELQYLMNEAIETFDFSIITGHRDEKSQNEKFQLGYSKLKWPKGKHNKFPSDAVDIAPYHKKYKVLIGTENQVGSIAIKQFGTNTPSPEQYNEVRGLIREQYSLLAGYILGLANKEGFTIRWGGDWDRDGDLFDNGFDDLGHFEIRR